MIIEKKIAAFIIRRFYIVAIVINCLYFNTAWGQDEPLIRPLVESRELKMLDKADQFNKEANDLMEEVNRENMQALSLQVDSDLRDEAVTKKSKQLEIQAWQKQVQASALYEKCHELKFNVYKKCLDKFWEKNPGVESAHLNEKLLEEQAADNYFQATSYRIDAKRMDTGISKVKKLTEANNLESEAIRKILISLSACYGLHGSGEIIPSANEKNQADQDIEIHFTLNIPDEDSASARLKINRDIINMYNRYISEGQYTDTSLSTGYLTGINRFDRDEILQFWHTYLYGPSGQEPAVELPLPDKEMNLAIAVKTDQEPIPQEQKDTEIGIVTDENRSKLIPADDEITYHVQIAAHRSELTQRALSRIYYGNKNVDMVNENGWFNYSVGDFSSYEEANKFRKSSGITNAFVVAYRKAKLVGPEIIAAASDSSRIIFPAGIQIMPPGLIFRIQIAACHVPLTLAQLSRIYIGTYPVEVVEEDGWYKYQFMGVRLYSDAIRILKDVSSKGAFIIAYKNGVRQNLAESVNYNRELEKEVHSHGRKGSLQEIEFHVQLAASKIAMSSVELTKLYNGTEKISVIVENGWYRYHLKAGNSLETAQLLIKKSRIDKAFIVAYRRAAKTELFKVLH